LLLVSFMKGLPPGTGARGTPAAGHRHTLLTVLLSSTSILYQAPIIIGFVPLGESAGQRSGRGYRQGHVRVPCRA